MALTTDAQTIDLRPSRVNFYLYQGDDTSFTVTFDVAVSLTNSTAKMRIKDLSGTTLLTLQTGGDGIVLAGQVFTTTITKAQSAALPTDKVLRYDWQWTNASSTERTVVVGTIQVEKQITS